MTYAREWRTETDPGRELYLRVSCTYIVCGVHVKQTKHKHSQFSVACRQSQTTTTDHPHPSAGSASAPALRSRSRGSIASRVSLAPGARAGRARPRCAACRIHVYVRATHALTKKAQASSYHLGSLRRQFDVIWHS